MSRTPAPREMVRRSLEMHPKTDERIKWLMDELEATSISEVIRRALQVFEALISDEKQGKRLFVEDDKGRLTAVSVRYAGGPTVPDVGSVGEIVPLHGRR